MEIITLIKANICRKKGSFMGIALLMVIISMSLTAILTIWDNCREGLEAAYKQTDSGNVMFTIKKQDLSEDVLDSLKSHPLIERVSKYDVIRSTEVKFNGNTEQNPWFLSKYQKKYKILNDTLDDYKEKPVFALKNGEIYITQGAMTRMECKAGDSLKISILGRDYIFKVKGIVVEPMFGSSTIGWKQVFVSEDDFGKLCANAAADARGTEGETAQCYMVQLYKSADCTMTDGKFSRVNLDTGIIDKTCGSLTKDMSMHYTSLFIDIILAALLVFILFLFVVVLIVMAHSIGVGIEMDYINIGVLKSQGFSKNRIGAVWILQYLLTQTAGALVGIVLAIPLCHAMRNVFQPIVGILAGREMSVLKSFFMILLILFVSAFLVFILTRKIGKISPVRAISGGHSEIYFDSRFKTPILPNSLFASLALRQFTSSKRKYMGSIVIVSILIFFMLTVTVLGNVLESKTALEAMGAIYTECSMDFKEKVEEKQLAEIEKIVKKYSPIEKKYYVAYRYFSVNGEEIHCQIFQNPDVISVLKGRAPLYNNEIVITEFIADELDLKIGAKAVVTHGNSKKEFIVSGIFQSVNDTGLTFAMSLDGARTFGVDSIDLAGYSLSSWEKNGQIAAELNASFGDILKATAKANGGMMEDVYTIAINSIKAVIYSFSVLFALIVVVMVCTKTFVQEKNDIGIYKALGFTAINLRIQFAVRFFVVALAGSLLGSVFSMLLSGRLLNGMLRSTGITNFAVQFTAITFFMPVMLICICFFVFAYFASGKVRQVEVRELVVE